MVRIAAYELIGVSCTRLPRAPSIMDAIWISTRSRIWIFWSLSRRRHRLSEASGVDANGNGADDGVSGDRYDASSIRTASPFLISGLRNGSRESSIRLDRTTLFTDCKAFRPSFLSSFSHYFAHKIWRSIPRNRWFSTFCINKHSLQDLTKKSANSICYSIKIVKQKVVSYYTFFLIYTFLLNRNGQTALLNELHV